MFIEERLERMNEKLNRFGEMLIDIHQQTIKKTTENTALREKQKEALS